MVLSEIERIWSAGSLRAQRREGRSPLAELCGSPAGQARKGIGWLIENDENVKVTQELLRHHHVGTTLILYAKAVTRIKCVEAQKKIARGRETQAPKQLISNAQVSCNEGTCGP